MTLVATFARPLQADMRSELGNLERVATRVTNGTTRGRTCKCRHAPEQASPNR